MLRAARLAALCAACLAIVVPTTPGVCVVTAVGTGKSKVGVLYNHSEIFVGVWRNRSLEGHWMLIRLPLIHAKPDFLATSLALLSSCSNLLNAVLVASLAEALRHFGSGQSSLSSPSHSTMPLSFTILAVIVVL